MTLNIKNKTRELIVSAIQSAMGKAKFNMLLKETIVNMSVPNDKWDCIVTKIFNFMDNENYKLHIHNTGIFKVAFIYEVETKLLFSIMRKSNYKDFLNGKKKATHYANCTLKFNKDLPRIVEQIAMVDLPELSEKDKDIIGWKKEKIVNGLEIEETDVNYYVTIAFEEDGFAVKNVEAFLTNEYYEVIDSNDFSEFIKPDIEDNNLAVGEQNILISIKQDGSSEAIHNESNKADNDVNTEDIDKSETDIAISIKEDKKTK